jgi:hypothetical protein
MALPNDISKIGQIANAVYNSVTANNTAVTLLFVGDTAVNTQISNSIVLISNTTSTTTLGLIDLRIGNTTTNVIISSTASYFSGNVGIGTSPTTAKLDVNGSVKGNTIVVTTYSGNGSSIANTLGTVISSADQNGGRTYEVHDFNSYQKLYSSTFISIGSSSNIPPSSAGNGYRFSMGAGDVSGRGFDLVGTSGGQLYYRARENGTWYLTSATTPSDYRIKQNVSHITSTIPLLKRLNPVSYRYKNIQNPIANNTLQWSDDGQNHLGFIAHEMKEVIPSAVNGEKDAVTDIGCIQPQTLNAMPIISLLTSALQEAVNKIENLETRLIALESK